MDPIVITEGNLSPISVDVAAGIVRDRACPEEERDADYDELYDFTNLFFDTFLTADKRQVWCIGPKLFNFEDHVSSGTITGAINGVESHLNFAVEHKRKVAYLKVDLPPAEGIPESLEMDFGALGQFSVPVRANRQDLFKGLRTVFTMFKFEPLEWVRDWVEFNVRYHGAEAFLIYNNDCPHASSAQIAAALEDIPGLKQLVVVDWFYPYGPQSVGTDNWVSAFCQVCMMEQARWRFLNGARSVLNGDVDEFVITKDHISIFDIVESRPEGYVIFAGYWIGAKGQVASIETRRHKQFYHMDLAEDSTKKVEEKWAIVPANISAESRWIVHKVSHHDGYEPARHMVGIRHFKDINTKWKLVRASTRKSVKFDFDLYEAYVKLGWAKPSMKTKLLGALHRGFPWVFSRSFGK